MRPAFPACKMTSPASSLTPVKTRPRRGSLAGNSYDPLYLVIGIAMLVSQLVGTQMKRAFAKYSQGAGHERDAEPYVATTPLIVSALAISSF
jgi:hypothetical protein